MNAKVTDLGVIVRLNMKKTDYDNFVALMHWVAGNLGSTPPQFRDLSSTIFHALTEAPTKQAAGQLEETTK